MAFKHKSWDPFVILFVLICLIFGWLMKEGIEARTVDFTETNADISLKYPASWLPRPDANARLSVFDPQSQSYFNTRITLTVTIWYEEEVTEDFIEHLRSQRESSYSLYHTISISSCKIDALETTKLDYVYATLLPGMEVPNVVRAIDIIFSKGDLVYILTLSADENEFEGNLSEFDAIISSIRSN